MARANGTTATTPASAPARKPVPANGTPAARIKPIPAKVLRGLVALTNKGL